MASDRSTMRAVQLTSFGGDHALEDAELPIPAPDVGEVRIRLRAAGCNPVDMKLQRGDFGGELPQVPGHDAAGVVDAIDPAVAGLTPGDRVFAYLGGPRSNGSYAEYVCAPAEFVRPMPDRLDFDRAAGVPLAALTAWQCLVTKAALKDGETVLIAGASGGVGTMACGICRHLGAGRIIATAGSEASAEYLVSELKLRPGDIVRYEGRSPEALAREVLDANGGRPVDVALDLVGGAMKLLSIDSVGFDGRVVTIVEEPADFAPPLFAGRDSPTFARSSTLHFQFLGARALHGGPEDWRVYGDQLGLIGDLLEAGELAAPPIERVGALSAATAAAAHERLAGGHVRGKLVMGIS